MSCITVIMKENNDQVADGKSTQNSSLSKEKMCACLMVNNGTIIHLDVKKESWKWSLTQEETELKQERPENSTRLLTGLTFLNRLEKCAAGKTFLASVHSDSDRSSPAPHRELLSFTVVKMKILICCIGATLQDMLDYGQRQ